MLPGTALEHLAWAGYRTVELAAISEPDEYAGLPEPVAQFLASFGRAAREGQLATRSDDFEQLTGRPPQRFRDLLEARVGAPV